MGIRISPVNTKEISIGTFKYMNIELLYYKTLAVVSYIHTYIYNLTYSKLCIVSSHIFKYACVYIHIFAHICVMQVYYVLHTLSLYM